MQKILLVSIACLTLVLNASGQEKTTYVFADELQREVTFLLLDKSINDVIRQLDSESPATVGSLLRRLVIYSRAGQTSRVRKTLEQLPSTANWQCPPDPALRWLIRNADSDLGAQRFYYEKICPDDLEGADEFLRLWTTIGNLKEIDAWLAERSNRDDEWLMRRVSLRAKSGTAGELLDSLADEIRANRSDWARLDRYLKANSYAGNVHDMKWLADVFKVGTAGEYFQLAERIRNYSAETGAKLLQKSLDLPFTGADAKLVSDLIHRYRSAPVTIKINWEKQLRYWTKQSLAETYQRMNQPLAAQPLVEELVSMKGDDILPRDAHQLAGAVQGGSGHRVVETKILRDETARRLTSEYWLERTRYYHGRQEYGLERDSYRQALIALGAKSEDSKALHERLNLVRSFAFFLGQRHNDKEDKPELEKLLASELSSVPPETDYAFQIVSLITQNELELDALRNSLLARRPWFLARLLDGRREWSLSEQILIQNVVHREEVPSELRDEIWSRLEPIVYEPGSARAYHLGEAMKNSGEWRRAIPLLRGYIRDALPENWEGYKSDAVSALFTAYCRTKQWWLAETLLLSQRELLWRALPNSLAEVAVVAAEENAIDDAMRLWQMSTNLDRRNLDHLSRLAQTKAKPHLQAMYSKMKSDDPLSTIPALALQLLQ